MISTLNTEICTQISHSSCAETCPLKGCKALPMSISICTGDTLTPKVLCLVLDYLKPPFCLPSHTWAIFKTSYLPIFARAISSALYNFYIFPYLSLRAISFIHSSTHSEVWDASLSPSSMLPHTLHFHLTKPIALGQKHS